jgi:hypothetical protein
MRNWEGISENKTAMNLVLLPFIRSISTSGTDYSCDPRPLDTLLLQLFVLWLMEHLSDSFSFQPHFFTLLFCLMRWKWDHCEKKVWRGIKLDSKKHFEPEYVAWAGPTSQLKKQYSWRQSHTQV